MGKRFNSIADVKAAECAAGQFYLSAGAMRFFGSKIESSLYDGRVFIMSQYDGFESRDRGPRGLRVFKLLEALASGEIAVLKPEDVTTDDRLISGGEFSHITDAQQYARDYVRGIEYHVQGNYGTGTGWETVTVADTALMAGEDLKAYRENEPEFSHRVRRVRKDV